MSSWRITRHVGDATYRWVREATLDGASGPRLVVIGKNPSTADDTRGDSTSRAVERFAASKSYRQVCLINLFALRSADPRHLLIRDGAEVPLDVAVGPGNDEVLLRECAGGDLIAAAWGLPKGGAAMRRRYRLRIEHVLHLLADHRLHVAGQLQAHGYPLHGYNWGGLRADLELRPIAHSALSSPARTGIG